ncbi:Hypothetical protein NGAL_HAMBI1145_57130 [Neorhizobium galegae bv. officinalis]|uniref:Integrase catalytic domain-containing protein n=1 Tax=Neorhizobium galegae bv. officinalis TaxID=323656 RepID=A0A0T7G1E7_NEOGA|nr:Hypothetical protein NGAL_HAMBI1145_57130 [Neorhizobium galegae bv. officinalis]CDZ53472.1 Hypothetical protein NGAL_HAMBI1189_50080 [Neorhizobium galegae bv. officinalis]
MSYNRTWINTTPNDFMQQLDSYIQWYNQHRIKLSLGGIKACRCFCDSWLNEAAFAAFGARDLHDALLI